MNARLNLAPNPVITCHCCPNRLVTPPLYITHKYCRQLNAF